MLNLGQNRAGRAWMEKTKAAPVSHFSQPVQQIVTMLVVCVLVAAGAWVIHDTVIEIIATNPLLNLFIFFVFALGAASCFWQVLILMQSVSWIEAFVQHRPGSEDAKPPRLLAPLAQLLRSRGSKSQISNSSSRSIQDSVATRIDEARDITRYIINLLIFLGLLGTFYGLATTVPAVVETIRSLVPKEGETGLDVFAKLMSAQMTPHEFEFEKDEIRIEHIGLAIIADRFQMSGAELVPHLATMHAKFTGEAEHHRHLIQRHCGAALITGQHVHQIDMAPVKAAKIIVVTKIPVIITGVPISGCGDVVQHRAIVQNRQVKTTAIP